MTYVRGRGGGRGMGERVRKILYHIYRERERERGREGGDLWLRTNVFNTMTIIFI